MEYQNIFLELQKNREDMKKLNNLVENNNKLIKLLILSIKISQQDYRTILSYRQI